MENIHEYLRSVGENIMAGRMKLEDFVIFKVCALPSVKLCQALVDI